MQASSAALKDWMSGLRPAALISLKSHRVSAQSPAFAQALMTELYLVGAAIGEAAQAVFLDYISRKQGVSGTQPYLFARVAIQYNKGIFDRSQAPTAEVVSCCAHRPSTTTKAKTRCATRGQKVSRHEVRGERRVSRHLHLLE